MDVDKFFVFYKMNHNRYISIRNSASSFSDDGPHKFGNGYTDLLSVVITVFFDKSQVSMSQNETKSRHF